MKYNFFLLKYSNRLLLLVAISLMLITCDIKDNDNLQNLSTIDRARLYTLFFYDSHFKKLQEHFSKEMKRKWSINELTIERKFQNIMAKKLKSYMKK